MANWKEEVGDICLTAYLVLLLYNNSLSILRGQYYKLVSKMVLYVV